MHISQILNCGSYVSFLKSGYDHIMTILFVIEMGHERNLKISITAFFFSYNHKNMHEPQDDKIGEMFFLSIE
jgi:hypothetical protein